MLKQSYKIKIIAILFILIFILYTIFHNLFFYKKISDNAFINSPLVKISSDINGTITLNNTVNLGDRVLKGQSIGNIISSIDSPETTNLKLQKYNIELNLKNNLNSLDTSKKRLSFLRKRESFFKSQLDKQKAIDIKNQIINKNIIKNQLNEQIYLLDQAKLDRIRALQLKEEGLFHQNAMKDYDLRLKQNSERVKVLREKLKKSYLAINASKNGLQIDSTRNLSEVFNNYMDIISDIDKENNIIIEINKSIVFQKLRLEKINNDISKQYNRNLSSNIDGVIWNILQQSGTIVSSNTQILEIADCSKITVDAFVSDRKSKKLKENQTVKIKVLDLNLEGNIRSIRRGTGRYTIGQYVVDAPTELMRRELPVRISTIRIDLKPSKGLDQLKKKSFCGIGQDVEVYI